VKWLKVISFSWAMMVAGKRIKRRILGMQVELFRQIFLYPKIITPRIYFG
jgi:hypothetical protein